MTSHYLWYPRVRVRGINDPAELGSADSTIPRSQTPRSQVRLRILNDTAESDSAQFFVLLTLYDFTLSMLPQSPTLRYQWSRGVGLRTLIKRVKTLPTSWYRGVNMIPQRQDTFKNKFFSCLLKGQPSKKTVDAKETQSKISRHCPFKRYNCTISPNPPN